LQAVSGFIDDQVYLAKGTTFEEANNSLKHMMEKPGGFMEWARTHNCEIEIPKCALIGFSKQQTPRPFQPKKRQPM
jgi:hypothetical protein